MSQIKQVLQKVLKIAKKEINVESKEISLRARKRKGYRPNIGLTKMFIQGFLQDVTKNLSEPFDQLNIQLVVVIFIKIREKYELLIVSISP